MSQRLFFMSGYVAHSMSHIRYQTPPIATSRQEVGMQLSNHAVAQMQQRAISETTVDYLIEWGRKAYDHRGGVVRYFDKASRNQLIKQVGQERAKELESQLDAYVVVSTSGRIITVGHRYKRINRH
jgi:hypothetical protein